MNRKQTRKQDLDGHHLVSPLLTVFTKLIPTTRSLPLRTLTLYRSNTLLPLLPSATTPMQTHLALPYDPLTLVPFPPIQSTESKRYLREVKIVELLLLEEVPLLSVEDRLPLQLERSVHPRLRQEEERLD